MTYFEKRCDDVPVILFIIVSICGLRAEFHPSKVEIRVRVPADAFFLFLSNPPNITKTQDTRYNIQDTSRFIQETLHLTYILSFMCCPSMLTMYCMYRDTR